jgi:D-alanyl-lipoteichoic acid acyltransferase DltB (MBOAT superfamily)
MSSIAIKVFTNGDFSEVNVEQLLKPVDAVHAEQFLITAESNKVSMDIPSSHAGAVKKLKVAPGDKAKESSLLLRHDAMEVAGAVTAPAYFAAAPDAPIFELQQAAATIVQSQGAIDSVAIVSLPASAQTIELRVPDYGNFKDVAPIEILVKPGTTVVKQLVLLAGSYTLIHNVTASWPVCVFLSVFTLLAYASMVFINRVSTTISSHRQIHAGIVALLFTAFVTLNITGFIGTLSGSSDSTVDQLEFLIGFNFYALFVAGVMSEVELPTLLEFALATAFGPKFLTGPLEKGSFIRAFDNIRINRENFMEGVQWILLGTYMCFAISRNLIPLIDMDQEGPLQVIVTSLLLELRFYFNFAGISFMAYGAAKIINVPLTLNFLAPFQSKNVVELWRRWHISFGGWFKHYVYKPLIMSGITSNKLAIAAFVFTLSGIWHGVSLNFLLWIIFQILCYVGYQKYFHHVDFNPVIGRLIFALYLCASRFLVTEFDHDRLIRKISNFAAADNYSVLFSQLHTPITSFFAVLLAIIFLMVEARSLRLNPTAPYTNFFSKSWMLTHLLIIIVIGSRLGAGAVYGRA